MRTTEVFYYCPSGEGTEPVSRRLGFTGHISLLLRLLMFSLVITLYFLVPTVWRISKHWLETPHLKCFQLELMLKVIF